MGRTYFPPRARPVREPANKSFALRSTILASTAPPVRPHSRAAEFPSWREQLRDAVRDPAELCRLLDLPPELANNVGDFPLLVPQPYLDQMRRGDPDDPLLRQVLPRLEEKEESPPPGFTLDPVGDGAATLEPGVLQKYEGRVLLVVTGACAVHCRYCFRRHYPYASDSAGPRVWDRALQQIADDPSLTEVILSGGDPLSLGDELLAELTHRIAAIPHVRRLRIHTRLPIVIPDRITSALVTWLTGTRLTPIVVLHANHANELSSQVASATARLASAGILLLNQAVLLRGVNDTIRDQRKLSERLLELQTIPYYLHQLDRVTGAAHFEVPVEEGLAIISELRATLPGYAVPRYVQEVAGDPNKRVLA